MVLCLYACLYTTSKPSACGGIGGFRIPDLELQTARSYTRALESKGLL